MNDKLLKFSASEVKKLHLEILNLAQGSLGRAVTAGKILTGVKSKLDHGEWIPWVNENLPFMSESTVKRYIRCYENRNELLSMKISDATEAYEAMTKHRDIPNRSVETDLVQDSRTNNAKPPGIPRDSGPARKPAEKPTVDAVVVGENKSGDTPTRKDEVGRKIPPNVIEDWDRAVEVAKRLRGCAQDIKLTVDRGIVKPGQVGDVIFALIGNDTVADAAKLYDILADINPYAVCHQCQGVTRDTCQTCRHRGWLSKQQFNSPMVSKQMKAILSQHTT